MAERKSYFSKRGRPNCLRVNVANNARVGDSECSHLHAALLQCGNVVSPVLPMHSRQLPVYTRMMGLPLNKLYFLFFFSGLAGTPDTLDLLSLATSRAPYLRGAACTAANPFAAQSAYLPAPP